MRRRNAPYLSAAKEPVGPARFATCRCFPNGLRPVSGMTRRPFPQPLGDGLLVPYVRAGQHVARPKSISPMIATTLMASLRNGATLTTACEMAGLSYSTVRKWIYRGEGRDRTRPATPEYVEFARLVRQNIAWARGYALASLLDQASKNPAAAMGWSDALGDDEWKAARREIREGSHDAPVAPTVNVNPVVNVAVGVDAREQNLTVVEIREEQMPEFLRALISQSRDDHAKILAAQTDPFQEQDIPDGHRSPRLGRLRVSSAD